MPIGHHFQKLAWFEVRRTKAIKLTTLQTLSILDHFDNFSRLGTSLPEEEPNGLSAGIQLHSLVSWAFPFLVGGRPSAVTEISCHASLQAVVPPGAKEGDSVKRPTA